ncbi:hypothetical protein [Mycobacteroides abscessus]
MTTPTTELKALPIRVRLCHGEGLISYSHRLAEHNHSLVEDIERGVRERGIRIPHRRITPERTRVWRELGDLHPRAFTTPATLNDEPITDRWICRGCARGEPAMGRTPHIGLVCLRHRRWIGEPQRDIHTYPPALAAENIYRRVLKPRAVLVDSFAMDLGKICAHPIFIGDKEIQRRIDHSGIEDTAILTYPEQVNFARLMTRKSFLEHVTNPALEQPRRRERVSREVTQILPDRDDADTVRAFDRIWEVVLRLKILRRETLLWGAPIRDTYYNLLRFIDLHDLAADDDIWAGVADADAR